MRRTPALTRLRATASGFVPTACGLVLTACGMSEPRFQVDGVDALCAEIAACTDHVEVDACVDEVRSTDRSTCDYDPSAAKDCIAELEGAACIVQVGSGRSSLEIPEVCAEVYPGCGPLYEEPYAPAF